MPRPCNQSERQTAAVVFVLNAANLENLPRNVKLYVENYRLRFRYSLQFSKAVARIGKSLREAVVQYNPDGDRIWLVHNVITVQRWELLDPDTKTRILEEPQYRLTELFPGDPLLQKYLYQDLPDIDPSENLFEMAEVRKQLLLDTVPMPKTDISIESTLEMLSELAELPEIKDPHED